MTLGPPGPGRNPEKPFSVSAYDLSEPAFAILRDLIQERVGLHYDNGKRDLLAMRLAPRVFELGLGSFVDYYYLLKYDARMDGEWQEVMNALSVPETYFWREPDQIQALVTILLPELERQRHEGPLCIWSAACASGEEPLSIAMALCEAGWFGKLLIEIWGSDGSPAALARARTGIYRDRALRALRPAMIEKYFSQVSGGWQIKAEVHQRVRWSSANLLMESDVAPLARAQVIFCRNVFIYFSESAIRHVTGLFHRYMPIPGYLFTGASESLLRLGTRFALEEIGRAFVYVKR